MNRALHDWLKKALMTSSSRGRPGSRKLHTRDPGLRRDDVPTSFQRLQKQRGAATVIAAMLLVTVVLTIGLATQRLSSTDVIDSSLQRHAVEALFLAETGLENAAQQLANGTGCSSLVMGSPVNFGNGDFQISAASLAGSLCTVQVTGRLLYGNSMQASRTLEGDIQVAGSGGGALAVGDSGTILQWDGSSWSTLSSGTTRNLRGIDCIDASNCMAVGQSGAALTWNGSAWAATGGINLFTNFYGVDCRSSLNDCHAAGDYFGFIGVMGRWTGGPSWALINGVFFDRYNEVDCATSNCYSARESGRILAWSGSSWFTEANMGRPINGIDCPTDSDCWAVGDSAGGGGNWNMVYGRTAGGWAASSSWRFSANPKRNLNDVSCIAVDDCWAVGDDWGSRIVFARYTGGSWGRIADNSLGTAQDMHGIDCNASDGTCWAVGENGKILYYDGSGWSNVSSGTSVNLYDVYNFGGSGGAGSTGLVGWREINA